MKKITGKLSLQWRLTLITALLMTVTCILMYFFISQSAVAGMEDLGDYMIRIDNTDSAPITFNMNPSVLFPELSNQLQLTKKLFLTKGLMVTGIIILLSSICTYFISRQALLPLRRLSQEVNKIEAQNLSKTLEVPATNDEISRLTISFNKMLARLDEAFTAQKQFSANAAHELRTPLAVMQAQLDLYHTTGHPATDACTEKTIQMVTDQNERLSKMVKTLLDMSELQTVARDEKIEVDALVEEVLADLDPLAEEKNVILESVCDAVTMMGSDILIYRVVYNLVENAIKYNNPGGKVQVTVCSDKEQICIQVMDNGSGIPADMKERVFEPFFRVDKSRSRALGGVGLGLALVREIVRVHDGAIRVLDNSNGGTTFEILFPETV